METFLHPRCRYLAASIICLGLMVTTVKAQGLVRGVVRDAGGQPIAGASVRGDCLEFDRTVEITTNQNGQFSILSMHENTWMLTIEAPGFHPIRALARGRIRYNSPVEFRLQIWVMEVDRMKTVVPTTGLLAGIKAEEIRLDLDAADALHAVRQYDRAIKAYQAILAKVPLLTTVNLQVGHVYREIKQYDKARVAYERVLKSDPTNEEARTALNITVPGQ